jgi:hypothetical protein
MRSETSRRIRLVALALCCAAAAGLWGGIAAAASGKNHTVIVLVPSVDSGGQLDFGNRHQCTLHYVIDPQTGKLTGHGPGHVDNASGKAVSFQNRSLEAINTVGGLYQTALTVDHVSKSGACHFKVTGEPTGP